MLETPPVRETTLLAPRPIRSRTAAAPVLIEVPTLPGTRPRRRARVALRPEVVRPRRRLRREVRIAGLCTLAALVSVSAVLAWRAIVPALDDEPDLGREPPGPEAFIIDLAPPIPVPDLPDDPGEPPGEIEIAPMPVAFPGYLLPGENDPDPDQEYGHARP